MIEWGILFLALWFAANTVLLVTIAVIGGAFAVRSYENAPRPSWHHVTWFVVMLAIGAVSWYVWFDVVSGMVYRG